MRRERENQHLPQLEMKTRKDDEQQLNTESEALFFEVETKRENRNGKKKIKNAGKGKQQKGTPTADPLLQEKAQISHNNFNEQHSTLHVVQLYRSLGVGKEYGVRKFNIHGETLSAGSELP